MTDNSEYISPDQICLKASNNEVKIRISKIKDDQNLILIEGKKEELEFLGQLLISQANFEKDCGFCISPKGAGSSLFANNSNLGVYIHRLPCLDRKH